MMLVRAATVRVSLTKKKAFKKYSNVLEISKVHELEFKGTFPLYKRV